MAARHGSKGLVNYKGVPVFRITGWDANINVDNHDVTAFSTGTVQWRDRISGLSDMSFTITGLWDMDGSTAQKDMQTNVLTPATGTVKLEADKETGGSYSCDAILSMSVAASVDNPTTVTFTGVSNGTVTYATTT